MSDVTDRAKVLIISSASVEPGMVVVAVADSGRGLHPDTADRIFESFFTTKPSGMGMGLSICRSIVELHGGRLAMQRAPHGTSFRFTVPKTSDLAETHGAA
jgi:signal transduction histidine kinase